jgi:hypothetical protein
MNKLLGKLIAALLHNKQHDLLQDILELRWAWGEVRSLLLHYVDPADCEILSVSSEDDGGPFDLSLLHSFMPLQNSGTKSKQVKDIDSA